MIIIIVAVSFIILLITVIVIVKCLKRNPKEQSKVKTELVATEDNEQQNIKPKAEFETTRKKRVNEF